MYIVLHRVLFFEVDSTMELKIFAVMCVDLVIGGTGMVTKLAKSSKLPVCKYE